MTAYDIVTVGGGVGGCVLAKAMAQHGCRVLVVEREQQFRDRVRGEYIFPWGVAETKALGVYDDLIDAGGHHPTYWADYGGPEPLPLRDLSRSTPQQLHGLSIYHPRMQEALLAAAREAGAEVHRGARVTKVEPGPLPKVVVRGGTSEEIVAARLVVGADGRSSMMRRWAGFESREDRGGNLFTGVLVADAPAPADRTICMMNPFASRMVLYVPQREGSGRAYMASRSESSTRLQGRGDFEIFLQECFRSGLADGLLDGATQVGPLATFDGGDSWVEHPYANGVALIGDCAGTSDPTWGQGLSLTLRDARTLRDALLADDDWDAAGHAYAEAHDGYHDKVRTTNSWFTRIFLEPGPDAQALRERLLPQLDADRSILPDTMVAGPDHAPPTEEHRIRIFGETAATSDA